MEGTTSASQEKQVGMILRRFEMRLAKATDAPWVVGKDSSVETDGAILLQGKKSRSILAHHGFTHGSKHEYREVAK